jgi:hypothetical protein
MSMIGNLLRVTNTELDEYLKNSSLLEDRIYSDEADDAHSLDIDKAWDGIVFLLTGQCLAEANHPLVAVLFSGQLVDDEQDLGYGPAHYLLPNQVADLNSQIAPITTADLKQRYDAARMTESGVYPEVWEDDDEAFDYLAGYFTSVQQLYRDAAANGDAIITFIN